MKVIILMSTYNGEKYLAAQLDSLMKQRGVEMDIYIRDDGSTDGTLDIIDDYRNKYGNIFVKTGKNLGPAYSFWWLLQNASDADYYAFCDQDDIWLSDKLKVAVDKLSGHNELPALYYSNTVMVNSDGTILCGKESRYRSCIPKFGQLIAENTAAGCTMVWNRKLNGVAATLTPARMRMHDHMLFLICQMCCGYVYYDRDSYIEYRQHEGNVVGGRNNVTKYIKSIWKYMREDSKLAEQALELKKINMSCVGKQKEYENLLDEIEKYRKNGSIKNRLQLACSGFYRQQSLLKNVMIWSLIMLHRF